MFVLDIIRQSQVEQIRATFLEELQACLQNEERQFARVLRWGWQAQPLLNVFDSVLLQCAFSGALGRKANGTVCRRNSTVDDAS
ncbi:hypothetical protein BJX96DRAFT_157278 [Aspergillus floccosus]